MERVQGSHPARLVATVGAVGHGVGAAVDVLGAPSLTAPCWRPKQTHNKHLTHFIRCRIYRLDKCTQSQAHTCIFLWHQQVCRQVGIRTLVTGTELETPHVTNHCGGVKGLLRKKHAQIRIGSCFFRGNLSSKPVPYLCAVSRIFAFDH